MKKRVSLTPAVFHLSDRVNRVAAEYSRQPIVPRGPALKPILDRVRLKAAQQLGASDTHEAVILTASGSGAVAAALGSGVDQQGVLIVANDVYGERQAEFCRQLGVKTIVYRLDPGARPDIDEIERLVTKHSLGTIGMVHGCTSVCLLNPVKEIGELSDRLGTWLIVDGIASSFVEELNVSDWHIDILIASTNKGLHSNPDLSFCLIDKKLMDEMAQRPGLIPYLDLYKTWKAQTQGSHPYTINIRALLEFEAALDDFAERGGLAGRIKMYHERLAILRDGYKKLGLKPFVKEGMPRQNIGSALFLPEGVSYQDLAEALVEWENEENECYEIYSAQGKLSDHVFRVFNMGEYTLETYHRFIQALEGCLNKLQKRI